MASVSPSPASLEVGVGVELNTEPVLTGVNVKCFFSVDSEDVVTGGVLGGLPKVKPTGLPRLPPEVPGVVVAEDAPKVNFVPVDGNPPNGERDGVGLSLSELPPPKIFVVEEGVEFPNPPNGLAGFSALVLPNPPKTLLVAGFSEVPEDPNGEGAVVLSFSLSSLSPNTEVVDGPPKGFVVVEEEDPGKKDVELGVRFPNDEVGLGLSFGGSSVVFFARGDAKKFRMVGGGLLSELVVPPKPNVGAGGPPEDSEVGVERKANPVDGFDPSVVVRGVKPLGLEPKESTPGLAEDFSPEVLGGAGVDNLGMGIIVDEGVLDKLGALNRTDGPGSGPSGSVFLGEFLKDPVSCLSHTDWMARRLEAYWSKTWERSTKGSSLTAFVRKVTIEWFKPRMLL